MVEAYNYFIGGYIPKVSPKTNVHDRKELKNKYKSIVSLNNANPLAMIQLSADTQIYALDVKEISMEMGRLHRILSMENRKRQKNMQRRHLICSISYYREVMSMGS